MLRLLFKEAMQPLSLHIARSATICNGNAEISVGRPQPYCKCYLLVGRPIKLKTDLFGIYNLSVLHTWDSRLWVDYLWSIHPELPNLGYRWLTWLCPKCPARNPAILC